MCCIKVNHTKNEKGIHINPEITREIGDFRILLSSKIKHIFKCTSISIKSN